MDNDDYNEYEEDIEENYYSSDEEDNKSFYTNNSDSEEELSETEIDKKILNSEKEDNDEDNDDEEIEDDNDDEEVDDDENNDDLLSDMDSDNNENEDIEKNINKELNEYEKKIKSYKKQNIEMFSKLGVISYLCNIVDYVKNGGHMLDNRNDLEYPFDTEESYCFESILLDTIPFEYVVNKHLINISQENKIICLKMALRCVDENKKIFFTENFKKRFPNFVKNMFNNSISKEEINEINKNKELINN